MRSNYGRKPQYCHALDRSANHADPIAKYIEKTHSASTIQNYVRGFAVWKKWCSTHDRVALPCKEDDVLAFLVECLDEGASYISIRNYTTAINAVHASNDAYRENGKKLQALLRAQRRLYARNPMRAVTYHDVEDMVDFARLHHAPLRAARDSAILLLLVTSAERRREFVEADVQNVMISGARMVIHIPASKGDPNREGQHVGIRRGINPHYCPIAAVREWLDLSGITVGPLFRAINRHGRITSQTAMAPSSLNRIVTDYAAALGLGEHYGPHSFRRGNATESKRLGQSLEDIQRHLRHKDKRTTELYIDPSPIAWDRNITGLLLR